MDHVLTPLERFIQILPYILPIVVLELILLVVAVVDLIRRERTRYLPKWAWALIVIFIQLFGPIAYFILGREE